MGSMLLIHSTRYQHAGTVFDGLVAVGCYVSFASLHRLPTVRSFGMAGFFAAGWGLLLAPLFVGFSGRTSFTSTIGRLTYHFLQQMLRRLQGRQSKHLVLSKMLAVTEEFEV